MQTSLRIPHSVATFVHSVRRLRRLSLVRPQNEQFRARVCNLQILRGCYRAAEYVLLREYGIGENGDDSRTRLSSLCHVTANANENVGVAWANASPGGGYFHHGNVPIAGCTLRLGCVIETSGYERVTPIRGMCPFVTVNIRPSVCPLRGLRALRSSRFIRGIR